MGSFITNLFGQNNNDKQLCRLRDYLVLAYSDGDFTEEERQIVSAFMAEEGISFNKIREVIGNSNIKDAYPTSDEERFDYLAKLITLMISDGRCEATEINYLFLIGHKLGFSKDEVRKVVAMYLKKMQEHGDERYLDLFVDFAANGGVE